MTVSLRKYKRGGWEVDIRVTLPDGTMLRERKRSPVASKPASRRWGEARERHLVLFGRRKSPEEVPTLEQFWPRFIAGHCEANHHKPSGIEAKQSAFRVHLAPLLGKKKLDRISQEDIARLKSRMVGRRPSTVNNSLTALNMALRIAVEWDVIERMPVRIRLLKVQKPAPKFYDLDQYRWLVDAASRVDDRFLALVLLGGDAGLRRGEIIALPWHNVDLRRGLLTVEQSEWNGKVTETKGMETRVIPMTRRLMAVLRRLPRKLHGERVLYTDRGESLTAKVIRKWMSRVQRRAGLKPCGGMHLLRHTFCSHLAMKGAPALSIQRLAGHRNLQTTLRYMHLAAGETDRAIRLLEGSEAASAHGRGDILETPAFVDSKIKHLA